MNRRSLLLVVLLLAACRPKPFREQARGLAAFGKQLLRAAPAAPPVTPPVAIDHIDPAAPPVTPPVAIDHRVDRPADKPATKTRQPPPSTKRPPVATPARPPAPAATFAARARSQAGANTCTAHPTMAQCTSHCTSVLRTSSLDRSPSAIRSCNCTEDGC